jgi:single-stranded-DNA-specific exonuclease
MKRWKLKEQARDFIHEGEISDPLLMADMEKAVEIIRAALAAGDRITVFGDYDCDGVTSTVMLVQYLTACGGEADYYLPSRDEGYGLSFAAIDAIAARGTRLIITVDTGVSSVTEAAYIKEKGISLIITDHHTVSEALPDACAVINPKRRDCPSPFKEPAGCGVVLKLIMALEEDVEGVMEQFADLAALGTIGDVVPLIDENRVIVRRGLEVMPFTENIGLYKLLLQCGFADDDGGIDSGKLTAHALSFTACPRINAAGRFAHAEKAAELLLCENDGLAGIKATELSELNNTRREAEADILKQVDELLAAEPALLAERVLVICGRDWHKGVIGIVSSRVLSKWGKPNIIISDDGEALRGSARSVEGFPLYPLLEHCGKAGLLEKFGGHVKAAGFSAASRNYNALVECIRDYTAEHYPVMPQDILYIDKVCEPSDLTLDNAERLGELEPFGEGNPVPLYLLQNCVIISKKPLKDGKFLSFNVRLGNTAQKVLCFNSTYADFCFEVGQAADIVVTLGINDYNGIRSVSAQLRDIRCAGFNQDRHFNALAAYESIVRSESVDPGLAERVIPGTDEIKTIYDSLRNCTSVDKLYAQAMTKNINYCKFKIILDMLCECGLAKHDAVSGTAELVPASGKADLENSETLCKVRALVGAGVKA